jgi:glycerol-3-phosphate acyltransferase PlsY
MDILTYAAGIIGGYLLGSIPFGFIIVYLFIGKDVRKIGSGRTGGTNVMRAAGSLAGVLTGALDILKGASAGWLAMWLAPGNVWLQVFACAAAVLGTIRSIFLLKRGENGRLWLGGGAGGATAFGGAVSLWPYAAVVIFPIGVFVFFFIGYASVTTISVAVSSIIIFGYRALMLLAPWQYVIYGVLILIFILYALRPNLERLRKGTERMVGLRAYFKKKQMNSQGLRN